MFGALFYLIPWMDVSSLGLGVYQTFKSTWILAFLIAPLTPTYYASQFIPLVRNVADLRAVGPKNNWA